MKAGAIVYGSVRLIVGKAALPNLPHSAEKLQRYVTVAPGDFWRYGGLH